MALTLQRGLNHPGNLVPHLSKSALLLNIHHPAWHQKRPALDKRITIFLQRSIFLRVSLCILKTTLPCVSLSPRYQSCSSCVMTHTNVDDGPACHAKHHGIFKMAASIELAAK